MINPNATTTESYKEGYNAGKTEGYNTGYSDGWDEGRLEGWTTGHSEGYMEGEQDGYLVGYDACQDEWLKGILNKSKLEIKGTKHNGADYSIELNKNGGDYTYDEEMLYFTDENILNVFNKIWAEDGTYQVETLQNINTMYLEITINTLMLKKNVNPKIVSTILGHSKVDTTLDIYSHPDVLMQQICLDVFDI